jgi:urea transporter/murein DD-endopeptidase MepM/ murein hydrolase activator NlpD
MRDSLNIFRKIIVPAILNSYSVLFFFNNRLLAFVILMVTFFNPVAGLSGLIAVLATVLIANSMGFDKQKLKQGIYSFNALLVGIGMGTVFEPGPVFFILLLLAALASLILSVILSGWLGKYGLPILSIPFVISFWLILLPSGQFANLGLTQRNVFWMNEMYSVGGKPLLDFFQTIENLPFSQMVIVYLRSLSSILFQDNLLTGIFIALALLLVSRITFLLTITGFVTAYLFAHFVGSDMASFSFYNIGANYILVAIAVGGFFSIPSRYSFLWVVLLIPLTSLVILFLTKLSTYIQLPFFSLPFSIVVISFLYFLILRIKPGKLVLTQIQNYSPEINLYSYNGSVNRLKGTQYFPLYLPFWGEWFVSQGYDGKYTHKGEWGSAVDFVLMDEKSKTYGNASVSCDDFYCYNKPVIAPADGIIAEVTDYVDDNEPGKVNSNQNWGNTIIIKHLNGLYSQLSHLRPASFRVKKGDFVRQGEIVAFCGNSGRSPEPHLHFQVQVTPLQGAKTIPYPFAYYLQKDSESIKLCSFRTPLEGDVISNLEPSSLLKSAFDYQPGMVLKFKYVTSDGSEIITSWEVFTDFYNYKYLYCSETQSAAYFINDGTMFYFTSFYGDQKSLLYAFYLTAYKVLLAYYSSIEIEDMFPLHIIRKNSLSLMLHDFVAPFYQFMRATYSIKPVWADSPVNPGKLRLSSKIRISYFQSDREEGSGEIMLTGNQIEEFTFKSTNTNICARRTDI